MRQPTVAFKLTVRFVSVAPHRPDWGAAPVPTVRTGERRRDSEKGCDRIAGRRSTMHDEDHARPTETELKLLVRPKHRARLLKQPALRAALVASPEKRHQVTTYFDTPELALAREGISLRVRCSDGRKVQTLKAGDAEDGAANGLALRRGEWEWPVERDDPDLGLLAQTPLDGAVLERIRGRLEPVFVTDIRRTACDLRLDGGTRAEAALDEGSIAAGEARQPVSELELELKAGTPGPLYHLARELHAAVPLTVLAESKAERGRRLKTGEAASAHKAADPVLPREADVAEGVRRVVESCLGQFVANRAAALEANPDGVHQMRVALRRLRSALALFDARLKRRAKKRFDAGARDLGRVLGAARDWDVFCLQTLPAAAEAVPGEDWAGLREAAEAERRAAHERLRAALDDPAATGLALDLAAEAAADPGASALLKRSARQPLVEEAPDMLDRLAGKVAKRGRKLERLSEAELHELRKALKKLRYGIDFLGGLYGRKRVKAYVQHCKELQEGLGGLNDAAVAQELARGLGASDPARLAAPAAALARWSRERQEGTSRHIAEGWRAFESAHPFWR